MEGEPPQVSSLSEYDMRFIARKQLATVAGFALAMAAAVAFTVTALQPSFYFVVSQSSSSPGMAQTFYDMGNDLNEINSARAPVKATSSVETYRFALPDADYRVIRFDPIDHGNADIVLHEAKIVDLAGRTVRSFPLGQFVPAGVSRFQIEDARLVLTLGSSDHDATLSLALSPPLRLSSPTARWLFGGKIFLFSFAALLGVSFSWLALTPIVRRKVGPLWERLAQWSERRPRTALLMVAALSIMISCYPVIFFGRSFVSGNTASMLYGGRPGLPGYQDGEMEDFKGTDLGAMMWQNLPYSFVESRALFQYGELPLWNRYNSCGTALLGQGQSMLGEPLHVMVLLARGASWAWDAKFLLARFLFCLALGLAVYASSRHLPSALILCFSSAFIGFFAYRFDHPAYFSMCYAPWILLCWIELSLASSVRKAAGWIGGLVVASWVELTSGTVKEAYLFIFAMHSCGLLVFLKAARHSVAKKFGLLILSGFIFVLLAAPIVFSFWSTLSNSYTGYKGRALAYQIQPSLVLGFFDDIFYRALTPSGQLFNPSANFLILLGCIFAVIHLRVLLREPIFTGVAIAGVASFAVAFGVIPHHILEAIPMVKHVWHIDTIFSCVLIIELTILAGFGVRSYMLRSVRRARWDFSVAAAILLGLAGLYFGSTMAIQRAPHDFAPLGANTSTDFVFYLYAFSLMAAVLALPWIGRAIFHKPGRAVQAIPLALLCLAALHWRQAFQLKTGLERLDDPVVNPLVRVDFQARSHALSLVEQQPGPSRVVGFGDTFFPGYNGMPGLESISGPDALMNPYYYDLLRSSSVKLTWGWRAEVEKTTLDKALPVHNLLNVGFFLDEPGQAPPTHAALQRLASLDLDVYRNNTSWPRAFFVDQVQQYESVQDFLLLVQEQSETPMAAVQKGGEGSPKTEDLPAARPSGSAIVSPATNYKLTSNTTTFRVEAPSSGVAVLTESYLGDQFIARLNGVRCDYFRVNHAFKGVTIPGPGSYEISFSYWPKHFTASLIMFGIGAGLLTLWFIAVYRPFTFARRENSPAPVAAS